MAHFSVSGSGWLGGWIVLLGVGLGAAEGADPPVEWKAGVAEVDITPGKPVWLSGYAARKSPSEGVEQPLKAKALALADRDGHTIVLITADLIGFQRAFTGRVTDRLRAEHGLARADVALFASHTHSGPMLGDSTDRMKAYGIDPNRAQENLDYTKELETKFVRLAGRALSKLTPARLSYGVGRAGFAMNRREKTATGFKIGVNPNGPTDKSVPVLLVADGDGRARAIVFGYACHNTTLTDKMMKVAGDFAGYAQEQIEAQHPGAVAMFITGCAGDANPEPRGTLDQAKAHGRELAEAVDDVLRSDLTVLRGALRSAYTETTLHFAGPNDRASYEKRLDEPGPGRQKHARRILEALDQGKPIESEVPYPVQAFAIGDQLTLVALGCEVVVDYAIRLQKELGGEGRSLWVAAYANDVFGYIPSVRVLEEGGYEGLEAYYYSAYPTPLAEDVESRVVDAAREVVNKVRSRSKTEAGDR